jgi:hypothetical protein
LIRLTGKYAYCGNIFCPLQLFKFNPIVGGAAMPTKKNNKVISKHSQAKQNKNPLFLITGGILVLLIASLLVFNNKPAKYTPEVSGSPSLQVDEELVDLGDVQLGKTVQTAFKISNVGDQELRFTQKPYVEVKEGC